MQLDVLIGFNGLYRLNTWTPVQIIAENQGRRVVGKISVQVVRGSEFRGGTSVTHYVRDVELPHNSRKRFAFVVPLSTYVYPLVVTLEEADQVICQREVDLREHALLERIAIGLCRQTSLDFLARYSRDAVRWEERLRVVYPHTEFLPEKWHGYHGVDLLVVHDVPLSGLREDQVTAIDEWVTTGGVLVLAGATHLLQKDYARISPLMPVETVGVRKLANLASLESGYGGEMPVDAEVVINESRVLAGDVVIEQDGVPLIVRREHGKGVIYYLAFDFARYPVSEWSGRLSMWRSFLGPPRSDVGGLLPERNLLITDETVNALMRLELVAFPSHILLLVFGLAYAGGLACLMSVRPQRTLHSYTKWALVCSFILVATGAGYYLFHRVLFGTETVLLDYALVRVSGDQQYAMVSEDVVLVSASAQDYILSVAQTDVAILEGAIDRLTISENGQTTLGLALDGWDRAVLRFFDVREFPLSVHAFVDGGGIDLELHNGGQQYIRDAVLTHHGSWYRVGDIQPNTTSRKRLAGGMDAESFLALHYQLDRSIESEMKHAIVGRLARESDHRTRLVGWLQASPLGIDSHRPFFAHIKLYAVVVDLQVEGDQDAF